MLTTFIIFILSTITAIFMLVNKIGQINGSRWYVKLHSHELEGMVLNKIGAFWDVVWHACVSSFKSASVVFLEKTEKFFMRVFFKLFRYISRLSDMVKGKDVPKSKGSASFFLKRIDETKRV